MDPITPKKRPLPMIPSSSSGNQVKRSKSVSEGLVYFVDTQMKIEELQAQRQENQAQRQEEQKKYSQNVKETCFLDVQERFADAPAADVLQFISFLDDNEGKMYMYRLLSDELKVQMFESRK